MKKYLQKLQTRLLKRALPIIAVPVNFLERSDSDILNIPNDLDGYSKFLHHKHGFRRFISNYKVDVSPSVLLNYEYQPRYDNTKTYYNFTETLLKDYKLIRSGDSIKNFEPPFLPPLSDEYSSQTDTTDTLDCNFLLSEDGYRNFLEQSARELINKNFYNIPGISNKARGNSQVNSNPSVKYVMNEPYQEKSITYLLLLAIYNYINNSGVPEYAQIINECNLRDPEKGVYDVWWDGRPEDGEEYPYNSDDERLAAANQFNFSIKNNFRQSTKVLTTDIFESFGFDIFGDSEANEYFIADDLIPKSFRTIFFLQIPYNLIETIENYDVTIEGNQIVNMNPLKPSVSSLTKKINYLQ